MTGEFNDFHPFRPGVQAVRGLLANPNGNVALLETRDGTALPVPMPFQTLYQRYGDSWRVPPVDSLLSECGPLRESGNPAAPFHASDLNPAPREWAMGVCQTYGVSPAWLQTCILDAAVLGDPKAAADFAGLPDPVMAF